MPQAIRSIARSAASTRTPPAQGSRRTVCGLFCGIHLFAFLQTDEFESILSYSMWNSLGLPSRRAGGGFGHPVRVVLPQIQVMWELRFWGAVTVCCNFFSRQRLKTTHCSAASTRTPPAQGSRRTVCSLFCGIHLFAFLQIDEFKSILSYSMRNSLGLPSRRAGGGFGHPVRVVLPQIQVMRELMFWGLYRAISIS